MHEVSLVHALFDQVDRAIAPHPAAAVRVLTVRIGARAGVERELFETAFEGSRDERGYGAAALVVVEEPVVFRCRSCAAIVDEAGELYCAHCGGAARLVSGDALMLDRVELEVRDV